MPKFYQTESFRRQNELWRRRLARAGFDDQEDRRGNLRQYDRRTVVWDNRERIETFFTALEEYLRGSPRMRARDRRVLELYAQGMRVGGKGGIARQMRIPRTTVNDIVWKYTNIVMSRIR